MSLLTSCIFKKVHRHRETKLCTTQVHLQHLPYLKVIVYCLQLNLKFLIANLTKLYSFYQTAYWYCSYPLQSQSQGLKQVFNQYFPSPKPFKDQTSSYSSRLTPFPLSAYLLGHFPTLTLFLFKLKHFPKHLS